MNTKEPSHSCPQVKIQIPRYTIQKSEDTLNLLFVPNISHKPTFLETLQGSVIPMHSVHLYLCLSSYIPSFPIWQSLLIFQSPVITVYRDSSVPHYLAQAANASLYSGAHTHTTSLMRGIFPFYSFFSFCFEDWSMYPRLASMLRFFWLSFLYVGNANVMGIQVCNTKPHPTAYHKVISQQAFNMEMNKWIKSLGHKMGEVGGLARWFGG